MRSHGSPMDCDRSLALLSGYVDEALAPEDVWRLHAHLHACPPCTMLLADLLTTRRAMRALPRPAPSAATWEAVAFTLRREGLVRPRWHRRVGLGTGAAVAAVLLTLWGYHLLVPAPQTASLEAYWREHATFSAQEEPGLAGAPALEVMEANYQLQGGSR